MTLRHLEIFVAVCDKLSMSRAAETLFISQSAVSHAIKTLEEEYGSELLQRRSGKLFLTEKGERMLRHAKHVLEHVEGMRSELESDERRRPSVRVGCTPSIGEFYIHGLIEEYERTVNEADIYIGSYRLNEIETFLLENDLDLALIEGKLHSGFFDEIPLFRDTMVYVCRKDSRRMAPPHETGAGYPIVENSALDGVPLYMQMWDPFSARFPEKLLSGAGLKARNMGSFNSFGEVLRAVELDLGVGAVSTLALRPGGALAPFTLRGMPLEREISLVMNGRGHVPEATLSFVEFVYGYVHRHTPKDLLLI